MFVYMFRARAWLTAHQCTLWAPAGMGVDLHQKVGGTKSENYWFEKTSLKKLQKRQKSKFGVFSPRAGQNRLYHDPRDAIQNEILEIFIRAN